MHWVGCRLFAVVLRLTMARLRYVAVWGLLAVFSVGGVVGPVVHQVHHATERWANAPAEACHSDAVHNADTPLLTEHEAAFSVPTCDQCTRRLLVVLPSTTPGSTPRTVGTTQVMVRSHLASVYVAPDRTIRGPPSAPSPHSA